MPDREPAAVFVIHAAEDKAYFEALDRHLAILQRRGLLEVGHAGRILAGARFSEEVCAQIDGADLLVLLVSPSFLADERMWEEQAQRALDRREQEGVPIVWIRLRAALVDGAPFEGLQALPRDGEPIGDPGNDGAWEDVAREIAALLSVREGSPRHAAGRAWGERPSDFRDRVERLCHLREKRPLVECCAPPPFAALWEVETSEDPIEVKPIAALDAPPTPDIVAAFDALLDARYRGEHPYVSSMLIHAGPAAPAGLVGQARKRGIALTSFDSLNRLIDFGAYLERLRHRLGLDPAYPPDLYVIQRGLHLVGREGRPVDSALDDLWGLVTDPQHPLFMLVLADFGTGKTFLLRRLAARLSEPGSAVVPVLVELRALEKARSLDALLMQHFALSGERAVDLDRFFHMLEQGRIALLFDGFDELVPRVTFERAAEHLETLIEAARGRSKVIITSRTQHFLTDNDAKSALARRADRVPHRVLFKLSPFGDAEIRAFLARRLGSDAAADRRFELLGQVTDLLGLSRNPRMLSFIAEIDEPKLLAARDRSGAITKTELYTLLMERWIHHEFKRSEYRGVPTLFDPPARWRAVLALAERLWGTGDRSMDLRDLPPDLREDLCLLGPPDQDADVKAHHAASGTLLVRDEEGRFSFLHRSILEFAAAWSAALALRSGRTGHRLLTATEMTDLMAEFFGDLVTPERVLAWARAALGGQGTPIEKKNAQRALAQLSPAARSAGARVRVVRRSEDLRGESFAGQDLRDADFTGADLSESVLAGADLTGASLSGARLVRADLKGAVLANTDLRGADFTFARLSGSDLRGAKLEGAVWRYAKLIGAQVDAGVATTVFTHGESAALGMARPRPNSPHPAVLPGPGGCRALAVSPDGAVIVSAYEGGTLIVWSMDRGEPLRTLGAHEGDITSVAYSSDGRLLATGAADKSIRLWDMSDGTSIRTLMGHSDYVRSLAFSPDAMTLVSGSDDRTVRIWSTSDGATIRVLDGHSERVTSVAFSSDGKQFASGSDDTSVRIWRVSDGAILHVLKGHSNWVTSVAFSPDGEHLASGSEDWSVCIWRMSDGAILRTLNGHSNWVTSVAFSPDGKSLASGSYDRSARIWRVSDGTLLRTFLGHSERITSMAFSPDGHRLVSGSIDRTVRIWSALEGESLGVLLGRSNCMASVAFGSGGKCLASGSRDTFVRLWHMSDGVAVRTLRGHSNWVTSVAFSPDGKSLVTGSSDKSVCMWRISDGLLLRTLRNHSERVTSVAVSPDGQRLASGSTDRSICISRMSDGALLHVLLGHVKRVTSVAFSPDGESLVSGSDDKGICIWRVSDGALLGTLLGHSEGVASVAFSPDGESLVSGSDDRSVRLWGASNGALLRTFHGHSDWIRGVTFSPDAGIVASASDDTSVRLWRVSDGALLHVLYGHSSWVRCVAFSRDGRTIASGSDDNSIRLWRVTDGQCLAVLYATPTGWVAFTPDGRYRFEGDLQGSFWHVIGLCRFEPGELDEVFPELRLRDGEPLFSV